MMVSRRRVGGVGVLVFAAGLAAVSGCSWDGLRRGIYEGATANEQNRQDPHGRPPEEPPPTFDQYERYRTSPDR